MLVASQGHVDFVNYIIGLDRADNLNLNMTYAYNHINFLLNNQELQHASNTYATIYALLENYYFFDIPRAR